MRTFHLRPEPEGFYGYQPLHANCFHRHFRSLRPLRCPDSGKNRHVSGRVNTLFLVRANDIFGGRQSARSIHFLTMLSFLAFLVVHVTLIVMTGLARNMKPYRFMGTGRSDSLIGMYLGFLGIGVVDPFCGLLRHYISWYYPRGLQHALKSVTYPMRASHFDRLKPSTNFRRHRSRAISGRMERLPVRDD